MQIKKLEMVGFKSFVDPTVIEFDAPLVGIVGPNGCGKSNVVDAIRWVMGEMSAKSLRGREMEDVIFNGSESRPAVNLAEVTLTFSTADGIAPAAYAGFSEIAITRRLYRSGESEYLINRIPCRLKDIIELFLGTGVGHRAYSVIEQGRIDFAINAKPDERRLLIEEAAGISKFKARKEAALRKMEGTEQNLVRLKDILGEIGRQIGSLDRQVKKAEKFREVKGELKDLELKLAGADYREATSECRELEGLLNDWVRRETESQARLSTIEAEIEGKRLEIVQKEREISQMQEKIFENSTRLKLLTAHQEFRAKERRRLEEEGERLKQVASQGAEVRGRFGKIEEEIKALGTRTGTAEQEREDLQTEIASCRERQEVLEKDLAIRREELGFKRSRLKSLVDLERNFEGYQEGVRTILRARREGLQKEGVLGVVADIVETPPQYEMAVSAALGEKLQYVIVKSYEAGVEAVSYLKSQASGRSSFISLDVRDMEAKPFPYEAEGVIGPLLHLVHLREEYSRIGTYLLGDVVLVQDLKDAIQIWRANGHKKTLVTLEGEVVDPYGVVSGGTEGVPGKLILEKKREIKELRADVARLEEEIGLLEDSVSQSQGKVSEMALALEEMKKKRHEEDLARISLEKEYENLKREVVRLDEDQEKIRETDLKLEGLRSEEVEERSEKEGLEKILGELTVQCDTSRREFEKSSGAVQESETAVRSLRKEFDLSRSHTGDLRVTLSRLEGDLQHLEAQMLEKYNVVLSQVAESLSRIEGERAMEEQRLAELKARIEKMGDVNLGSIPEYEELKNRRTFIEGQIQDLEQAIEGLKKAIQKINLTSKKRFEETFQLVEERFRALFPRLFGGGRAELRLVETDPALPAGVDLFVQPPGKRLSHIGLLSGGEKALSAVAFVFSLFLVKPSPFCLLDEVDAPLDDANVDRFHRLLSEMLQRSQFILITHNRRTMEQCHLLYGVTMEEAGSSKLVSVRLNEALPLAS